MLYHIKEHLDVGYPKMISILKTDQYEGRMSYLDGEIKRVEQFKDKIVSLDSLTYNKKIKVGSRIEVLAASVKQDLQRLKQEPVWLQRKHQLKRNFEASTFMDNVQNETYLAEIDRLIRNREIDRLNKNGVDYLKNQVLNLEKDIKNDDCNLIDLVQIAER